MNLPTEELNRVETFRECFGKTDAGLRAKGGKQGRVLIDRECDTHAKQRLGLPQNLLRARIS
jgi:hypothetical protein